MRPYRNTSGNSGVTAYETGPDFIIVEFRGESRYRYDHERPGPVDVARMKELAERGEGLATYISQHVGARFACRVR